MVKDPQESTVFFGEPAITNSNWSFVTGATAPNENRYHSSCRDRHRAVTRQCVTQAKRETTQQIAEFRRHTVKSEKESQRKEPA